MLVAYIKRIKRTFGSKNCARIKEKGDQREMRGSQKGVRHRQRKTEADSMPEDYWADLLQICPHGQLDQRLDQD